MNMSDVVLPELPNGSWVSGCCGEACFYAEVAVPAGFLKVKTSHDNDDLQYQVRRYGLDRMALDDDYIEVDEADLIEMLK